MVQRFALVASRLLGVFIALTLLGGCAITPPHDQFGSDGNRKWDRRALGVVYAPSDKTPIGKIAGREVNLVVRQDGQEFVNKDVIASAFRQSLTARGYSLNPNAPTVYEVAVQHFSADQPASGFGVTITGTAQWTVTVRNGDTIVLGKDFQRQEKADTPGAGFPAIPKRREVLTRCLQENVEASTADLDVAAAVINASASPAGNVDLAQNPPTQPTAAHETFVTRAGPSAGTQPVEVRAAPLPMATPVAAPSPMATPAPASSDGRRFAVVIGISDYKDSRIPRLRYADADARGFAAWLTSQTGGRYAPADVKVLVGPEATSEAIRKALFQWLGQALAEDMVTIYFSGHGTPASPSQPQNLFLVPYDTDYEQIAATGFPMWDIETALKRFIVARRVVVIADACHAGGVGSAFVDPARSIVMETTTAVTGGLEKLSKVNDGIAVITSASPSQLSLESEKWGGGHGLFTHFLLKGLAGEADYNHDGKVTLGELTLYLSEQVRHESHSDQSPEVAGKFDPALTLGR